MIVCNLNNNSTTLIYSLLIPFLLFVYLSLLYYSNIFHLVIFASMSILIFLSFVLLLICVNKKIIIDNDKVIIKNKKKQLIINSSDILYVEIIVRNRYEGVLKSIDFPRYIIHTLDSEFAIYNKKFHFAFNKTFLSKCRIRQTKVK